LTGLLNRSGFQHWLETAEIRDAFARRSLCALYLDVNNFKTINDSLGHASGDALLRGMADRLRETLPSGSHIARLGGDEFVALATSVKSAQDASDLALMVSRALDGAYSLGDRTVHSSSSVGFAMARADATDANDLVRRADTAMYHAKAQHLQEPREYDAAMDAEMRESAEIERLLRLGMANDEFSVVYQPILNLKSGAVEHVEALLRLSSAERGPIAPDVFIPVAERTGLIQAIGLDVLRTTCRDIARWPGIVVSVNVSPVQLLNTGFVDAAIAIADEHGVPRSSIIFELTEGVLIESPLVARRQLDALKAAGFSIFLDDFGSGFSSIGYLSQFPFDGMKIDKSLVQASSGSQEAVTMMESIIAMAKSMKLAVVAEGVETEDQKSFLCLADCGWMQGYLLSRPLPVAAVDDFLADNEIGRLKIAAEALARQGASAEPKVRSAA
jgi:diguanylate cyclase (GGDEF)-like protein